MAKSTGKSLSNLFVWIILGLLIVALAGFGIGSFGGSVRTVATVGDEEVTVQEYARALQQDQRALSQQTGQNLSLQQMQSFGLDQITLQRLIATAALNNEAARLGLSVGDAEVARQIRNNPAFGGIAGSFDREGYAFALRNAGLSEREFEDTVRKDTARGLLQGAILGGITPSDIYAETLAGWRFETRDITFAQILPSDLGVGGLAPSEDDLKTFHTENAAQFTLPEARALTVAWANPDMLVDDIDVPEATLRELYAERADEFSQPERVLAERLNFADTAAAQTALSAIENGATSFDTLVADRGLSLEDVDQGELARADLPEAVAEALFGLEEPGLVGPLDTALGPALYRVNAILNATEVPFEDVAPDLRAEYAADQARRRLQGAFVDLEDLLAAGATLEELAAETDLTLESVTYRASDSDGIAGYAAFRAAASAVQEGDFPELLELSDGGLFALRLDEVILEALQPLETIRDEVEAAWRLESDRSRLLAEAGRLAGEILPDTDFAALELRPETVTSLTRDDFVADIPRTLLDEVFAAVEGSTLTGAGSDARAFVIRIDKINPADLEDAEVAAAVDALRANMGQGLAQDIFEAYGQGVQAEAGLSVNQTAITAVHSSLTQGHGGY